MLRSPDSAKLPTTGRHSYKHSKKLLSESQCLLAAAQVHLVVVPCTMLGVHLLAASQGAARFSMTAFNDTKADASQGVLLARRLPQNAAASQQAARVLITHIHLYLLGRGLRLCKPMTSSAKAHQNSKADQGYLKLSSPAHLPHRRKPKHCRDWCIHTATEQAFK